jgi:hypothetical protein
MLCVRFQTMDLKLCGKHNIKEGNNPVIHY